MARPGQQQFHLHGVRQTRLGRLPSLDGALPGDPVTESFTNADLTGGLVQFVDGRTRGSMWRSTTAADSNTLSATSAVDR